MRLCIGENAKERLKLRLDPTENGDAENYILPIIGLVLFVVAAFIKLLPIFLLIITIIFICKCRILFAACGYSRKLAYIPIYNLYLSSKLMIGCGWIILFFLASLIALIIFSFFLHDMVDIIVILVIATNIFAAIFNYKFYHHLGEWGFLSGLVTFFPSITILVALINYFASLYGIEKYL